jgi:hypothetical protein
MRGHAGRTVSKLSRERTGKRQMPSTNVDRATLFRLLHLVSQSPVDLAAVGGLLRSAPRLLEVLRIHGKESRPELLVVELGIRNLARILLTIL